MDALPIDLPTPERSALDWDRLVETFAWMRSLAGCPQDPVHHAEGDVWVHTRMVCETMIAMPSWRALPERERATVLAAGIFHDIAKPATTRCDADGRITAHGHSRRGALMARSELYRMGVPFALRESVVSLVAVHQLPFFLIDERDARRRAIGLSYRTRCDHLAILAEADMRGRVCEDASRALDNVALFRALCEEDGVLRAPWDFANETSRFEFFQRPERDPSYAAWEGDEGFEVTLLSGLPGAGKDTWVRTHGGGREVISLDALRDALDAEPTGDQGAVVTAAKERARVMLRRREGFIWNATNLTRQRRSELVALCTDYGARVRIVYVESPWRELLSQNRARERRVPEAAIEGMLSRWEVPDATEAHRVEYVTRD